MNMLRKLGLFALGVLAVAQLASADGILRQSTSRVVRICGVVAVGDGFTPVTTLALSTADEAEALRDNTATLDISGATWAAVTGADGCYSLTLDTTATNTVGELIVQINDDSLVLPIWREFTVVETAVYDAFYADAVSAINVNVATITDGGIAAADFAAGAIDASAIATDAIGAAELAAGAIAAAEIANAAIDAATFAAGAIDAAAVADATIDAATFASAAIDAAAIATDAIGAAELAADAIAASEIATDAIGAAEIAADAIAASEVAADAIGASELATDAIGAAEIAASAIAAAEIADNALDEAAFSQAAGSFESLGIVDQGTAQAATGTTLQLRSAAAFADDELVGAAVLITGGSAGVGQTRTIDDYVGATDTATVATWNTTPTGTITYQVMAEPPGAGGSVTIGAGGITASSFASGAIDAAAIATDAIGAAEVAANAIGAAEVADGAIDAATFAAGAIDAAAIAADAVGASELAANAIGASELADNAIDEGAFSQAAGSFESLGIIDQGTAQAATGTTLQLRSAAAFADDEIIGATILITGGSTGVGQSRTISDYVSSTDTATVTTWTTTPTGTITYEVFGTSASAAGSLTASDVWAHGTRTLTALDEDSTTLDLNATTVGGLTLLDEDSTTIDLNASFVGGVTVFDEDSTTIDINATTIGTAAAVTTVNGLAANVITATSINADALTAAKIAADVTTELQTGLATAAALDTVDNFVDTEISQLLNARTQIIPAADADGILTSDSGDTNTLVDTELTFANDVDIDGAYVVRSDGQRCFIDSFSAASDTIEFGACTFTGAWSTQTYKIYPAGTQ